MRHNNIILAAVGVAAMTLTACGDFLDKEPSKSQYSPITKSSQLLAVYNNTTHLTSDNVFAIYSTDNTEIKAEQYVLDASTFSLDNISPYLCNYNLIINRSSDNLWTGEYAKIYDANLIINSAGEANDNPAVTNRALAGAYLMRAYSYHVLATTYCKPYSEANASSLGVPIRLGLDFTENLSRGTLQQVYDQILSDIAAADEYTTQEKVDADNPWYVSKCAVNAMYARVYMSMGDFAQAQQYNDAALASAPDLYDYNTIQAGNPDTYPAGGGYEQADTLWYSEWNDWPATRYYRFQEEIFPRLTYTGNQWDIPSDALVASYDHDTDLRFKWFFIWHGNRRMNCLYPAYRYCQFDDDTYTIEGPSTPELLLNRAEIMVRSGQWQQGLQVLQPLFASRHTTGTQFNLTASSQDEALRVVLAERNREFPFSFIHFMDIKRYAATATTVDDVSYTRQFFAVSTSGVDTSTPQTYNIDANKLAMPIFQAEITASQGVIEQTPEE